MFPGIISYMEYTIVTLKNQLCAISVRIRSRVGQKQHSSTQPPLVWIALFFSDAGFYNIIFFTKFSRMLENSVVHIKPFSSATFCRPYDERLHIPLN